MLNATTWPYFCLVLLVGVARCALHLIGYLLEEDGALMPSVTSYPSSYPIEVTGAHDHSDGELKIPGDV